MSDGEKQTKQHDRDRATSIFEQYRKDRSTLLSIYDAMTAAAEIPIKEFSRLLDAHEALMNLFLTVIRIGDATCFLAVDVEGVANINLCDPNFLAAVIMFVEIIQMICLECMESSPRRHQLVVYDIIRDYSVDQKVLRFASGKHLWGSRAKKGIKMLDFAANIGWVLEATETIFSRANEECMARGRAGIGPSLFGKYFFGFRILRGRGCRLVNFTARELMADKARLVLLVVRGSNLFMAQQRRLAEEDMDMQLYCEIGSHPTF